jgi:hypothetical protein
MYATGRTLAFYDMPTVRRIVHRAETDNYSFESIVFNLVSSDAFRTREASVPGQASVR